MAGYPKIWTTILHEDWFVALTCLQRGIVLQLLLLAKQNGDTGSFSFSSWSHLAHELCVNRSTLVRFVSKNNIQTRIQRTVRDDGSVTIKIVKYREYQDLTRSIPVEKSTQVEHPIEAIEAKQSSDEHSRLIAFFVNGFEQEYKTKYMFKGGADAKRLNDLLKAYGYEKAREIVKMFLLDKDAFLTKTGHTVGLLVTRASAYAEQLSKPVSQRNPDVPNLG